MVQAIQAVLERNGPGTVEPVGGTRWYSQDRALTSVPPGPLLGTAPPDGFPFGYHLFRLYHNAERIREICLRYREFEAVLAGEAYCLQAEQQLADVVSQSIFRRSAVVHEPFPSPAQLHQGEPANCVADARIGVDHFRELRPGDIGNRAVC